MGGVLVCVCDCGCEQHVDYRKNSRLSQAVHKLLKRKSDFADPLVWHIRVSVVCVMLIFSYLCRMLERLIPGCTAKANKFTCLSYRMRMRCGDVSVRVRASSTSIWCVQNFRDGITCAPYSESFKA